MPFPESVQFQLPPQFTAQPTVAEGPRAPQLHLAQLDLDGIQGIGGDRPVFRKPTQRSRLLPALVEDLQRLAPSRLLAVVDLTQIQHAALDDSAGLKAAAFLDAVVAVFLTVLLPPVASQEHAPVENGTFFPACIEGRAALQAVAKMFYRSASTYRAAPPDFAWKVARTAKVGLSSSLKPNPARRRATS